MHVKFVLDSKIRRIWASGFVILRIHGAESMKTPSEYYSNTLKGPIENLFCSSYPALRESALLKTWVENKMFVPHTDAVD